MKLINNLVNYLKYEHYGCYILSKKPLILTSYWHDFLINRSNLKKLLPPQMEVWFIFQIGYYKSEEATTEIKSRIKLFEEEDKNFHFIFLNNSEEEHLRFLSYDLNSRFINQNAFLDENRYRIIDCKKRYDAIYLARFTPVKRHFLARKIKKLFLIGSYKPEEVDYYKESREILEHADHKEKVWGKYVTNYMNRAKVGLCLSDLEGAMFVSTEYLLSGLPVVSTPSLGGRDIYYQNEFARIVSPNEDDVANAVYEFIDKPPSARDIRNETLEIMRKHRKDFIEFIQQIYEENNAKRDFSREWETVFTHKLGLRTRVPYIRYNRRIVTENFKIEVKSR